MPEPVRVSKRMKRMKFDKNNTYCIAYVDAAAWLFISVFVDRSRSNAKAKKGPNTKKKRNASYKKKEQKQERKKRSM